MRPVVVAVDGFDGSGKTTLIDAIENSLRRDGVRVTTVPRRGSAAAGSVAAITELLLRSDGLIEPLTAGADQHLRLARLLERSALAQRMDSQVVLLDRWIPSDLARSLALVGPDAATAYREFGALEPVDELVILDARFPLLWSRIDARTDGEKSPKERLGRAHNELLHSWFLEASDKVRQWIPGHMFFADAPSLDSVLPVVLERLYTRLATASA